MKECTFTTYKKQRHRMAKFNSAVLCVVLWTSCTRVNRSTHDVQLVWNDLCCCAAELRLKKLFEERESLHDQVSWGGTTHTKFSLIFLLLIMGVGVKPRVSCLRAGETLEVSAGSATEKWHRWSPDCGRGRAGERDGLSSAGPPECELLFFVVFTCHLCLFGCLNLRFLSLLIFIRLPPSVSFSFLLSLPSLVFIILLHFIFLSFFIFIFSVSI